MFPRNRYQMVARNLVHPRRRGNLEKAMRPGATITVAAFITTIVVVLLFCHIHRNHGRPIHVDLHKILSENEATKHRPGFVEFIRVITNGQLD